MVFQSYALFPHMNVFDNVAFGLRRKSTPKAEVTSRVTEILGIVGLDGYARRRPREMSGGQQQRVALARALVNRPRALLLDEPLGALDLKLRQAMQIELKRIQREVGITFVYVTHDQGEALTMSDRIAVMNEGAIEQLASPRDIYEKPATKFVAGFIGTSNLLSGTVSRAEAGGIAVIEPGDGQRILVPAPGAGAGDAIEITVRPEKITLSAAPPPAGACALRGTVSEVVYLGTSTSYNVTTSIGAEVVVFVQNAHNASDAAGRGDAVWLAGIPLIPTQLGAPYDIAPPTPNPAPAWQPRTAATTAAATPCASAAWGPPPSAWPPAACRAPPPSSRPPSRPCRRRRSSGRRKAHHARQLRQLGAVHRPEPRHAQAVHRGDRDHGDLLGGHPGRPVVLRQDQPDHPRWPGHRLRHHGDHRRAGVRRAVQLGDVTPLDQSKLANFYKYSGKAYQNRAYDPGNVYSVPWASGSTGIAWNPKYVKTPPTSLADLWNPAYAGHVGMMSDTQEIANFGLLKLGINPETSTENDWKAAAAELLKQKNAHIVRKYYDQGYIDALSKGDIWITMAWSGDIFQQNLSVGDEPAVRRPQGGRDAVDRQHDDPEVRRQPGRGHAAHRLVLQAGDRGDADRGHRVHLAGPVGPGRHQGGRRQGGQAR